MHKKSFLVGAALLSGLLLAPGAHAARIFVCDGDPILWHHPFAMVQNLPSIPNGTPPANALQNAIDRWNGVQGMKNMIAISPFVSIGDSIEIGDDQNDAGTTGRAKLGGHNGLTFLIRDLCLFSAAEWEEADVAAANDLSFDRVGETSLAASGRLTFLHEIGHAHGLAHSQRFNVMRRSQPLPLVGGPGETADVLPDDAIGGRFLYPNGNDEVNLFASAHRRTSNDNIVLNNSGTLTFCAQGGANITLTSTVGNNGTVNIQQTERWWVSLDPQAHSGGIEIFHWNGSTFNAGGVNTRQVTFKMPALAPGTYFLFHGVDVLHEVPESREDDNNVREGMKIQVNNC